MDYISKIKKPITGDLDDFIAMFNETLSHSNGLLSQALDHIKNRGGKRMRPMLILLIAKAFGEITDVTQRSAVGLELLHTASLVHDDVVDESSQRRGQASVNATYDNKVAVLVGDYILSTALLNVSLTGSQDIVSYLARLGQTLSNGEILQLTNISNQEISEEVYYDVIRQKPHFRWNFRCAYNFSGRNGQRRAPRRELFSRRIFPPTAQRFCKGICGRGSLRACRRAYVLRQV